MASRYSWRMIDIVSASVLGVFCGLIFWVWNGIGYAWYEAAQAVTPGLGGIATGIWFLGATLGACIIRKPGAAIYVEVVAACVSAALGNIWGLSTIISGLVQGLGAEIIFALFVYRSFNLLTVALSGVGAACGAWIYEFATGNYLKTVEFNIIYLVSMSVSGAVLAGVVAWVLTRALKRTGVLSSLSSPA